MYTDEMLNLFQMLINNLEDAVFLMDKSGKVILANNATYKLYGCSKKQFEEHYCYTRYLLDNGIIDRCEYQEVIATKKPNVEVVNVLRPTNLVKSYYIKKVPVFDPLGNVKYLVGWARERGRIIENYKLTQQENDKKANLRIVQSTAPSVIYRSSKMAQILRMLKNVAASDASVLLLGETGAGKEVMANYIHQTSRRSKKDMIVVNCAALTPSLFESELFGYTQGSFTGAAPEGRHGLVEAADQSTLFLDEIDSVSMELQGKLLRVLETKTVQRVGSNKPIPVDFRLIAATNRDLRKAMDEGKFRSDLYYRLNVVSVTIPPLRERKEDIRPLAEHFLKLYCDRYGMEKEFDDHVFWQLEQYSWPGNVRELRHLIERTILTSDIDAKRLQTISFVGVGGEYTCKETEARPAEQLQQRPPSGSLDDAVGFYERRIIEAALRETASLAGAAARLEISLSTLERRIRKYGIHLK